MRWDAWVADISEDNSFGGKGMSTALHDIALGGLSLWVLI